MKEVINFILENWKEGLGISVFILELIVRIKPTNKDWSIVNKIISILDIIIPNLEVNKETGKIQRKKKVGVIKMIGLFFVLSALSVETDAQQNPNNKFGAIYSYLNQNSDSVNIQSTRTALESFFGNTGALYFDRQRDKWRVWDGTQYVDLIRSTGSGDMILAATQTSTGKKTFQPSATNAGLNIGSLAGNPSAPVNGDTWLNTSDNIPRLYTGGTAYGMLRGSTATFLGTLIPYYSGSLGVVASEAAFSYDAGNNVLDVDRITLQPSATLAGLSLGSLAGDPSSLNNGEMWYSTATNTIRARVNGSTVSLGSGAGDMILASAQTSTGKKTFAADATNPGLAFNNVTGSDPSTIGIGDMWFRGDLYTLRIGSPAGGNAFLNIAALNGTLADTEIAVGSGASFPGLLKSGGSGLNAAGGLLTIPSAGGLTNNGSFVMSRAANKPAGTAVLVGGTVTVSNTLILATSIILLTSQIDGGTPGFLRVSARVNATSFTITSSSGTDTSTVGYLIIN